MRMVGVMAVAIVHLRQRDSSLHIPRVPHHNRVDDQAHTGYVIQLRQIISLTQKSLLSEKHLTGLGFTIDGLQIRWRRSSE